MRDTPPEGFVDFVVARGPALRRTALLLTRQEQSAEDLVQIALAKAWRSWGRIDGNHEAYVGGSSSTSSPRRGGGAGVARCRQLTCPRSLAAARATAAA